MGRAVVGRALLAALAAALPLFAGGTDINPPQLDRRFGEGCWVRFFEAPAFEQPLGRLAGALYVNSLARPGLIGRMTAGGRRDPSLARLAPPSLPLSATGKGNAKENVRRPFPVLLPFLP